LTQHGQACTLASRDFFSSLAAFDLEGQLAAMYTKYKSSIYGKGKKSSVARLKRA